MFFGFVELLRRLGLRVSFGYVMEFFRAMERGLVDSLERLFLVSRLIFVKRVEDYDLFERAFLAYFLGRTELLGDVREGLVVRKVFEEWLRREVERGDLEEVVWHTMSLEELMERFWRTYFQQRGEHHFGGCWVGTGGSSPFGHSGWSRGGVRVMGRGRGRSARKVWGQRRYISYSGESGLRSENIAQALSLLKDMVPVGARDCLDVEASVERTSRNGGEVELVFSRRLRNRVRVMLFLDNGGYSMDPYISQVRVLFSKVRSIFREVEFYYFHNCIYDGVYEDEGRTRLCSLDRICQKDRRTRLFIVGDATMAPSELFLPYGSIDFSDHSPVPAVDRLILLRRTFPYSVWLTPIPRRYWLYQGQTFRTIGEIFRMEDLTLDGLRRAVEYLQAPKELDGGGYRVF